MKVFRIFTSIFIFSLSILIQSCGSGSAGDTTYGSLSLAVDKTTVNSGESAVATVTLVSSIAGKALNGITVRVMSSDQSCIKDVKGSTNAAGIATIVLPAEWVSSDKEITLVAGSDGISQSSTKNLTVVAPKLTCNMAATTTVSFKAGGGVGSILLQGTVVTFKNGSGNPISNQSINLYIDSITGKTDLEEVIFNPVQGNQIIAPPGFLTVNTDSSGTAQIPMSVTISIPSVSGTENNMVVNWRAVTQYQGLTFTLSGSSNFKVTAS